MKFTDKVTFTTRVCEICGNHVGRGYDHSKCSKAKQEKYSDAKLKKAKKILSKENIDYLSKNN